MGCQGICLPAAKETIGTWIGGFGFGAMPFEREAACRKELHILVFPGTRLLVRDFKEAGPCVCASQPANAAQAAMLLSSCFQHAAAPVHC